MQKKGIVHCTTPFSIDSNGREEFQLFALTCANFYNLSSHGFLDGGAEFAFGVLGGEVIKTDLLDLGSVTGGTKGLVAIGTNFLHILDG
ncbi:hypothetical protein J0895_18425, partial [Phormidium pseudopriestleyi FRX01]|nr:hypothetical protein [Phormidium pseudopriestleyi FRX01]